MNEEEIPKDNSNNNVEQVGEYVDLPQNGDTSNLQTNSELSKKLADEVGIDEQQAEKAIRLVQQSYSGPIPFAAELNRYNKVSPGLGTEIARDYLKGREHDRECEKEAVALAYRDSARKDNWLNYAKRGQSYGMVSQILFICAAFVAMYLHYVVIAGLFVAGPALGVVAQFIKGTMKDEIISSTKEEEKSLQK